MIIWFTGISGVGKTTIAKKLKTLIKKNNINRWRCSQSN